MLGQNGRGVADRLFGPLARALVRRGVSPDAVTITGTVLVVALALTLLPLGHLAIGALAIGTVVVTDSVDGLMARAAGQTSRWGAFLDSTLDRVGDAAVFSGVLVWSLRHLDGTLGDVTTGLALSSLVLGSVVPYARARAEGLGMRASTGIAERSDRLVVVLVACFLVGLGLPAQVLTVALGLLTVASAVTVGQRMAEVRRQSRGDDPCGGNA